MQHKIIIPALLMAAGVVTAGGLAYAQKSNLTQNDATAMQQAKISLAQAVTTAEQHVGGKASRAELQNENGRLVYGVEVAGNGQTLDVKVNAIDGSVVSVQADQGDTEAESGQEERDED